MDGDIPLLRSRPSKHGGFIGIAMKMVNRSKRVIFQPKQNKTHCPVIQKFTVCHKPNGWRQYTSLIHERHGALGSRTEGALTEVVVAEEIRGRKHFVILVAPK